MVWFQLLDGQKGRSHFSFRLVVYYSNASVCGQISVLASILVGFASRAWKPLGAISNG